MIYKIRCTWVTPVYSQRTEPRMTRIEITGLRHYAYASHNLEQMTIPWRVRDTQVQPAKYGISVSTYRFVAFPAPLANNLIGFLITPQDMVFDE
jgi:hypothetical protein